MYKVFLQKGEVTDLAAKKSIFERLGLIEISVKEGNLDDKHQPDLEKRENNIMEEVELDEANILEDNEFEYIVKNTDSETLGFSSTSTMDISSNPVEKEEVGSSTGFNNINQPVDQESGIEEKLDVLIGAFEKNKLLTIDDIYKNYKLISEPNKTIFMGDILMKALPENLPIDIKRESVLSIMDVSNIEKDDLLNDAYKRIDALNTVLKDTVQNTEEMVLKNEASIKELDRRIEDLKKATEEKIKLKEDQNTIIEYEIQKIINIVEFIKPKK